MNHNEAFGNYYLISHLTLISGLTDRTIRSYIANGILQGEKINGLWHFTPDQVDAFLRHPSVQPSIMAKRNAIVYDFMAETKKQQEEACLILDLPGHDKKQAAEYFCYGISNDGYLNIRFSYNHTAGTPRIILQGYWQDINALVQGYFRHLSSADRT